MGRAAAPTYNPLVVIDSQIHTPRAAVSAPKRALATLALLAFPLLLPSVASGQLRVDTTLYSSAGSCANCDLSGKRLNGMTLRNANFAGSLFNDANLSGGKLDGSNLTGAHFRKAQLFGVRGTRVVMHGAVLEDATLTGATLTHSTLQKAKMSRAELTRGQFHDNDFRQADLSHARLSDANLARSRFHNASLSGAEMDGAELSGADMSAADLRGAKGLTQGQLDTACGDRDTQLPPGLVIRDCTDTPLAALDRAIGEVEVLMGATANAEARTRLTRIHADLTQSRDALSR